MSAKSPTYSKVKDFLVVTFMQTNEVALVPKEWLQTPTTCKWPNFTSQSRLDKAVRQGLHPEKDWLLFDIRILKSSDDYIKARQYCVRAEEESAFSSTEDELIEADARKRNRKPNRKYIESTSSEEEEAMDIHVIKNNSGPAVTPKPPSIPSSMRNQLGLQSGSPPLRHMTSPEHQLPQSLAAAPSLPATVHSRAAAGSPISHQLQLNKGGRHGNVSVEVPLTFLVELKEIVKENNRLLQQVIHQSDARGLASTGNEELPEEIAELLPIATKEIMKQVEDAVEQSKSTSLSLARFLAIAGGEDLKTCLNRVMSRLLSHPLALQHNWKGHGAKHSMELSPLVKILKKAVRLNPMTKTVTDQDIENQIKLWLRQAKDRHGGRMERARRSILQAQAE